MIDDAAAERSARFALLVAEVAACRRCPAMEGRRRVLSPSNGPITPRVLFIAEAPGRFGAEQTGVPLAADQSGRNFARLLVESGLTRDDIFITNAVLCNPQDDRGRNRPPRPAEVRNCAVHLRAQFDLITAPVVVTLGAMALRAIGAITAHQLTLSGAVARPVDWNNRVLFPLYHPSPQALMSRPLARQIEDYRALGRLLREIPFPTA